MSAGLLEVASAIHTKDYSPGFGYSTRQLEYMTGMYATKNANPQAYKSGGEVVAAGSILRSAVALPSDLSKVLTSAGKAVVENLLGEKLSDRLTDWADERYEQ